jgi:hypothetical protein
VVTAVEEKSWMACIVSLAFAAPLNSHSPGSGG